jgi:hypothetical protein
VKQLCFLSTLLFCACASACPSARAEAPVDLVIPNFEADKPACHVRVGVKEEKCTDQSCVIPTAKDKSVAPVELRFTCFPSSAPTGFENPAPYAKIRSIQSKSAKGALSLIDDITTPASERQQELNFCLYGDESNFCGSAKISKVHGKESPTVAQIISLVKRMEWAEGSKK